MLQSQSVVNLKKFAEIVTKYEDTNILVEGHTDSSGSDAHNQKLSEQRSQSVAMLLTALDVDKSRLTIKGYGESQPIASNETTEGRAVNRRVEIAIVANEKLKETAKSQTE